MSERLVAAQEAMEAVRDAKMAASTARLDAACSYMGLPTLGERIDTQAGGGLDGALAKAVFEAPAGVIIQASETPQLQGGWFHISHSRAAQIGGYSVDSDGAVGSSYLEVPTGKGTWRFPTLR